MNSHQPPIPQVNQFVPQQPVEVPKPIIFTPAIAQLTTLVTELRQIKSGMHSSQLKLKQEKEKDLNGKFDKLTKYENYQLDLIHHQSQCEKQQAKDELEDFISSYNKKK